MSPGRGHGGGVSPLLIMYTDSLRHEKEQYLDPWCLFGVVLWPDATGNHGWYTFILVKLLRAELQSMVNPGSVSCHSLCIGDVILKINNRDVTNVTHSEGQTLLLNAGNLLQLTIKKCRTVAASAPVSPTHMAKTAVSFTAPTSPTSFRSFSPASESFSNYRNFLTDDESLDNARYFTSLPRHASISGVSGHGMHSTPRDQQFDPHQYGRKNSAPYGVGSYTMPKPTPYRPSGGNIPTSHNRSGSDSSGYQTSSYGPSPNTFDSPLSSGTQPASSSSSSYKPSPASYSYGPGPGIAPPSYESSIEDRRGVSSSSPAYQRQYSSGSSNKESAYNQNGNMYSPGYESSPMYTQTNDTPTPPNRSYSNSTSYSPFQRQPSREAARHNTYEQSVGQDYPSYQQQPAEVTQSGGYHRQPSSEYQRQPSYSSAPQSPLLDRCSTGPPRRQVSQSTGITADNSTPRGFQRQGSFGSDREVVSSPVSFQRQTSSGSFPKSQVYAATLSSSSPPTNNHVTNEQTGTSGSTSYGEPTSPSSVKSSGTGINSIEDILSPFEKFPNYYNDFINSTKPATRHNVDSGVSSDISDPTRSYKSPPLNNSSEPPKQSNSDMYGVRSPQPWEGNPYQPRQLYGDQMGPSPPGIPPPPPPPTGPIPPPPPPPPPAPPLPGEGYVPTKRPAYKSRDERTPGDGSPVPPGMGQERGVPDAVLSQMMKKDGNAKPFAYITGGIDLKEFKNKRNRPPPPVMPKSYRGPNLNEEEPPQNYTPPQPIRPQPPHQAPPQQYQPPPPPPPPAQYQFQPKPPQFSPSQYQLAQQYQQQEQQYQQQQPQYQQQNKNGFSPIRTPPSPPVRGSSGNYYRPIPSPDIPHRNLSNFIIPPRKTIRTSEKPLKDIEKSAVYQMIQESENEGKNETPTTPISPALYDLIQQTDSQRYSPEVPDSPVSPSSMFLNRRAHGLSFQVLQWMTETDEDAEQEQESKQAPRRSSGMKDPSLRHNAEDDEMRFSGLRNRKKDIPSKAFKCLNKMTSNSDDPVPRPAVSQEEQQEEPVGRYDQTSIRYTGKHIPSPSFRVLQNWAEIDPLPPQKEEPEPPAAPVQSAPQAPPQAPQQAPRKLMITTQSRAVPPPPEDTPSTDF
ncbi:histone-lysine N-methyltransferase SETD1A-like isoform X3 [Argopecten irradians]|uniref:histone-lysine N-methyltransferase SETD1A-like isoform X3 n=1 Tax=Argopecten irradians TaxID=31199 RepID=UPI003723409E